MPAIYNPEMSMAGFGDFGDVVAMLSRYFTTLDPAAGAYYEVPRVVISAGADFEFETWISPSSVHFYVLGDSQTNDGDNRIVFASGNLYGSGFNNELLNSKEWMTDGKLHKFVFKTIGDTASLYVDGELQASRTVTPTTRLEYFDRLGGKFGGATSTPTFSGVYADTKLTIDGVLKHHWKIDGDSGVIVDYANPLGAELVVNGEFESGYIDAGATYTHINTTDTNARTTKWLTLDGGTKQLRVKRVNSTRCVVQFSNDNVQTALASIVYNENAQDSVINVPEGATNVRVYYGHSSDVNPSISIKRADGYGQAINVTQADRELMTFDESRNAWIGQVSGNIIEVA